MSYQQIRQLANYLQIHLLEEYQKGHRLTTTRERYLQFAKEAREKHYRVKAAPTLTQEETPKTAAPDRLTQKIDSPKEKITPVSATKKELPPKNKAPSLSSHNQMRSLIEASGHKTLDAPLSDGYAKAKRRRWILTSAKILLLCETPSDSDYQFYERMTTGLSDRLAMSFIVSSEEAHIWGGWDKLKFGPQIQLLLLSPSLAAKELDFSYPTLPLKSCSHYEPVEERRALWTKIQSFFK